MLGMTEFSSNWRPLVYGRQDERRMSILLYLVCGFFFFFDWCILDVKTFTER